MKASPVHCTASWAGPAIIPAPYPQWGAAGLMKSPDCLLVSVRWLHPGKPLFAFQGVGGEG